MDPRIEAHYYRDEVAREIADFSRNRWLALEGEGAEGRVFIRWWRGRPITVSSPHDLKALVRSFRGLNLRSIYATVGIYRRAERREDVEDPGNVVAVTPSWDVDASLEDWEAAVEAARLIVEFLEEHGVTESVYLKWSGEGVHVHIHEGALSAELLARVTPLKAAHAIVEYSLHKLKESLLRLASEHAVLKVENLMEHKRVFTVPLSVHRRVDKVAVCFKPDQLDSFDPSWADLSNFKHDTRWREHREGEADQLALEALRALGGLQPSSPVRTRVGAEERRGRLGRFQVMALLQAARYYLLMGDLERAKSFGLNRAIFYAWAKRRGRGARPGARPPGTRAPRKAVKRVKVAGEEVYVSEDGWFVMGGVEQRPADYDRQVASAISGVVPYEEAWRRALEYLRQFPRSVLEDPQEFYRRAYEPVRDEFLDRVLRRRPRSSTLDEFL